MKNLTTIIKTGKILLFSAALFFSPGSFNSFAADTLYLAGCPDQWPFEFYDSASDSYKGILPDMLQIAGESAGISIHYLDPSSQDNRLALASVLQVDGFSVIGLETSDLPDGLVMAGQIACTESMPAETRTRLVAALNQIDEIQMQELYLQYTSQQLQQNRLSGSYFKIFMTATALFLICFLLLLYRLSRKTKQIERLAFQDEITGRDNFAVWKRKYQERVREESREHYAIVFLFADVETISHIYGYEEAENALKLISDTCASFIQEEHEAFCRFHEFNYIFFLRYTNVENLRSRVRSIQEKTLEAFQEAKKTYFLDIKAGIYRLHRIDDNVLRAIQCSEVTLEYARMHYLNYAIYDMDVETAAVSGYAMEHEAIHGLMHQEFVMYLQPIIQTESRAIVAAEALVRWRNPKRGLLNPEEFLKVMKKKQLIGKMNMDIFRQGCALLKQEEKRGNKLQLLFNFTSENIGDEHFVSQLNATIEQYQLDAEQIIIQLNQVMEIVRADSFKDTIRALRKSGFHVCLAGLELDRVFLECVECGVDIIKLRHELIRQLEQPNGVKIMQSIVTLCHDMGLTVICIGVENQAQADLLPGLGCKLASGFYYYYPLSQQTFLEHISGSDPV